MSSTTTDDHGPAWLSHEYDAQHREETEPLFGTGTLPSQDSTIGPDDEFPPKNNPTYGSVPMGGGEEDHPFQKAKEGGKDPDVVEKAKSTVSKKDASSKVSTSTTLTSQTVASATPSQLKAAATRPHRPAQNPCLWLFHLLEGVAILTSLCLMTTQILPFFLVPKGQILEKIGFASLALKFYISLFCLLFIVTELNLPIPFLRNSLLLQTYATRGVLYSFLGLNEIEDSYSERVKDMVAHESDTFHVGWAPIFMQISSWLMFGLGIIYITLGVCCLKRLRDQMKQKEKDDWRQYREAMKEWKRIHG